MFAINLAQKAPNVAPCVEQINLKRNVKTKKYFLAQKK
jgi:hypothetical protein